MTGPFGLLYILVLSRKGKNQEGRYQLDHDLDLNQTKDFLRKNQEYFEGDGRHSFYIKSHDDGDMLVYDRHNVIYIYGDLAKYCMLLSQLGYRQTKIDLSFNHAHHYYKEFDEHEDNMIAHQSWIYFPLEEQDQE